MASVIRFVIGLAMAALVAGITQVLFVITPAELIALPEPARSARLAQVLELVGYATALTAIFAAGFAVLAAVLAGSLQWHGWPFFVFAGLAIALLGFATIYAGETPGPATIANPYALAAYAFSGLIGGYAYWLVAGPAAPTRNDPGDFTSRGYGAGAYAGASTDDPAPTIRATSETPADLDIVPVAQAERPDGGPAKVAPVSVTDRPVRSVNEIARRLAVVTPGEASAAGEDRPASAAEATPVPGPRPAAAPRGGSVPRTGPQTTTLAGSTAHADAGAANGGATNGEPATGKDTA
ncbi:MAG: hypothetical protein NW205_11975 [Hyphomicrobiaceae bacterium]|nr:hypothetical protein [Hyphomicrobiaceae bacterium]